MEFEEKPSLGRRLSLWLKHCLLVIVTVGLESSVTLEVIFMIANIQTLGVPIRYSSVPATVSASFGVVLIPTMGFVMNRWAKSKSAKALILIGTCSLEIMGNILVFTGNAIKLVYYDEPELNNGSTTTPRPNTTQSYTAENSTSGWTNTTLPWTSLSSSSSLHTINSSLTSIITSTYASIATTTLTPMALDVSVTMETILPPAPFSGPELPVEGEENIRFYAVLAMIGYCLLDCGYDSSNCFLKTFALASTAPKDHASIIVKAVFVSSFGGCLIAVLGSIGLGSLLTAGSGQDENAYQSAFVAALCFIILVSGLITSLTTGFCCSLSNTHSNVETFEASIENGEETEKAPLIAAQTSPHDHRSSRPRASRGSLGGSHDILDKDMSGRFSGHAIASRKSLTTIPNHIIDSADLSPRTGFIGFIFRYKRQIQINLATFFVLGSLYAFEVYAVNFVGYGIYNGNPLAPVGSEAYQNYIQGIAVGSQGTLIYYVVFTFCTSIHEMVLNKLGWKVEVLVASLVYVLVNLVCALTVSMWAYYITAVWTGIFRAVVVTIPYILANTIAIEEGGGRDSGVAIATVAAMLPLGFSVSSALMGPLIDVTGDPATPLYYTAVTSFLGAVVFAFLKID